MASLQHRRTHNLLLISKLLNQRDAAAASSSSPFTLVLDSLEQSGQPLLAEFMKRANASKIQVIFLSFGTLRKPPHVDFFIPAWKQSLRDWQREVGEFLKKDAGIKKLLVLDNLNSLAASTLANLPGLLSSFIGPTCSLLALYHLDVPVHGPTDVYAPSTLSLLRYLATTIFTTHSLHHILARKSARERSHAEPSFGLEMGVEGVLQGLGANGVEGVVLEMEHRRKSGRGVRELYFLPILKATSMSSAPLARTKESVILLEDHPQYRSPEPMSGGVTDEEVNSITFEMGLTERQKKDREGVVLPYFDAQKGDGGGEGGRILYDLGSEDDFDEDEDEI